MTYEEAIKKFGSRELHFCQYYKYGFTYSAIIDNNTQISAYFGGNADDIYKDDLRAVMTLESLSPRYITIIHADGEKQELRNPDVWF